ncbi:transcriptional adapter 3 [Culicoides brevitarsis]|uniref:transcriptional adapter 3 n=1 Tax=Culicoides brevitarsis TaxID=469753 RepID=UPI00307C8D06
MNSKRGVTASKNRPSGATSSKESLTPIIPHIKIVDNAKTLPKFTAALARNPDDILPAEELDAIQLELEHLLSTVALRYRVLKSEVDTIDKAEENRDKRGRVQTPKESSPNKKKKFDERNRFREGSGKLFSTSQRQKMKNTVSSSPVPSSSHEDSMDAPPSCYAQNTLSNKDSSSKFLLPKNDIPNKFWLSVEPYCMPITQEDIKLLDDLIEEYTGTGLPAIPDLGPHYAMRWAMEDLKEAQEATGGTTPVKKENGHTTPPKKGEGKQLGDGVLGPLTQRLVSALIEDTSSAEHASNGSESGLVNGRDMQPIMKNGINIEKRLKKELVEHGILEAEDLKEEDDEILTEIKRVRAELTAIGEYNANELRKLHTAAVEEMRRLDVKKQLEAKDQEIIEFYRKLQMNRQKHRPLTKAEKDEVIRLCEEQRRLSEHLETFTPPGPHFSID